MVWPATFRLPEGCILGSLNLDSMDVPCGGPSHALWDGSIHPLDAGVMIPTASPDVAVSLGGRGGVGTHPWLRTAALS